MGHLRRGRRGQDGGRCQPVVSSHNRDVKIKQVIASAHLTEYSINGIQGTKDRPLKTPNTAMLTQVSHSVLNIKRKRNTFSLVNLECFPVVEFWNGKSRRAGAFFQRIGHVKSSFSFVQAAYLQYRQFYNHNQKLRSCTYQGSYTFTIWRIQDSRSYFKPGSSRIVFVEITPTYIKISLAER